MSTNHVLNYGVMEYLPQGSSQMVRQLAFINEEVSLPTAIWAKVGDTLDVNFVLDASSNLLIQNFQIFFPQQSPFPENYYATSGKSITGLRFNLPGAFVYTARVEFLRTGKDRNPVSGNLITSIDPQLIVDEDP